MDTLAHAAKMGNMDNNFNHRNSLNSIVNSVVLASNEKIDTSKKANSNASGSSGKIKQNNIAIKPFKAKIFEIPNTG